VTVRFRRLAVVGIVVLVAVGCSWRPPAAEVDGAAVPADRIADRVEMLRENTDFADVLLQDAGLVDRITDGRAPAELTSYLLRIEIYRRVLDAANARAGVLPADEQVATVAGDLVIELEGLGVTVDERVRAFATDVAAVFVGQQTYCTSQGATADDACALALDALFVERDIEVDPRFGTWDKLARSVVSPDAAAR